MCSFAYNSGGADGVGSITPGGGDTSWGAAGNGDVKLSRCNSCADSADGSTGGSGSGGGGGFDGRKCGVDGAGGMLSGRGSGMVADETSLPSIFKSSGSCGGNFIDGRGCVTPSAAVKATAIVTTSPRQRREFLWACQSD